MFFPFEPAPQNNSASYQISARFCTPTNTSARHRHTVIIATHGLGFDKSYWDPNSLDPTRYSMVHAAIQAGYSILYYDRLGTGASSTISGYAAQASNQIAILQQLAHLVRQGSYTSSLGLPSAIVLLGHSFGSALTAGVAAVQPDIAEGLILTGFGYNDNPVGFMEAGAPRIADLQRKQWKHLDTGYLNPVDISGSVSLFYTPAFYDLAVVEYAFATSQPWAISEFLTQGMVDLMPNQFTGSVMLINGASDFIFCFSNCTDYNNGPSTASAFANAKNLDIVSYPGAAHVLNFALNATGAFDIILGFMEKSGL
ncbi:Alpha/Beta hydrolase protein [Xylogone sp. PMI_703]|nr:Alpha/Beta hydrolase protein [Xylogone sp. PMI_703]